MASYETPVAAAAPVKPPGPSLKASLIVTIVGVLVAVPSFVIGLVPILRVMQSSPVSVPGTFDRHLGSGRYMLYQRTGTSSLGSAFSQNDTTTLRPDQVTVTGADGGRVSVFYADTSSETITHNQSRYTAAVEFTTPTAGTYTIAVTGSSIGAVIVARPITDTISHVVGWFLLAGAGGVCIVVGVVLLIVGAVRRGRAKRAYAYGYSAYGYGGYGDTAGTAPAGWYPDPGGSARQRYWDGTRWTEHLH